MNEWYKDRENIKMLAKSEKTKRNMKPQRRARKAMFTDMESALMAQLRARRARGQRCGPRWIRSNARQLMKETHPGYAAVFKATEKWLRRFVKRNGLVLRKRTNTKRLSIAEKIPKYKRWYARYRRFKRADEGKPGYDPKWVYTQMRTTFHWIKSRSSSTSAHIRTPRHRASRQVEAECKCS